MALCINIKRWFQAKDVTTFFSSSLSHLSWLCFGLSWLCLTWRYCLLCVVCCVKRTKMVNQLMKPWQHALLANTIYIFRSFKTFKIRLSVLTVLCCCPAPVLCRETGWVLCRPVCSLLRPPADFPAGCRCIAPSDTWPEAELRGETLTSAPGLPWTTLATGSTWQRKGKPRRRILRNVFRHQNEFAKTAT